jgi:hypothetical protein
MGMLVSTMWQTKLVTRCNRLKNHDFCNGKIYHYFSHDISYHILHVVDQGVHMMHLNIEIVNINDEKDAIPKIF